MVKLVNSLDYKNENKTIILGVKENDIKNEFVEVIAKLKEKKNNFFKLGELTEVYPITEFKTKKILFVGLGDKEEYDIKDVQTIFSKVGKNINEEVVIDLDSFNLKKSNFVEIAVETLVLVNYKFNNYKTDKTNKEFEILLFSTNDVNEQINNGEISAQATNNARTLVNEPRNKLTPTILANYSEELAKILNVEYKIYNKKEIEELKMGAFLAVNQGSKEEAKLIHLKYRGDKESNDITALVGKGLTYDSGGYSIKPKTGMVNMKSDMGGAATVLGAFEAIVRKQLNVNIDIIIATTENLINSEAIVPDDVIVTMSGKTIEVLNTDAEGRLTLVDAVTFAKRNNATSIIDVATLTGGVITALGYNITGAFTNNNDLLHKVKDASKAVNENIWELPVDQFRERCKKSDIADYNNSPGGDGHASFAAAIIAEFVEDTPWVHLDIAGTATNKTDNLLGPSGGTGVMVRTLTKLFE